MNTLVNFRDLGGLSTVDGRVIKTRRLLRSGEIVMIGEADTKTLRDDYDLRQIIDFRERRECEKSPDDVIPGVQYCSIDIMKDMEKSTGFEDLVNNFTVADADQGMSKVYREMILDKTAQAGYRQFIRQLACQKEGASIFHCFAGKDRTGVGAAILLTILGVSRADIFVDYLKTNGQRAAANQAIITQARKDGYSDKQVEVLRHLMCVKAEYLEEMYRTIEEQYGTFERYIEEGLLVSKEEVLGMQMLYLE